MRFALPCFVVAVLLALSVGRFGLERMPQVVSGDDALSVAFGDAKSTISAAMVHKADSYFHGGIDMECAEGHGHHHDEPDDHHQETIQQSNNQTIQQSDAHSISDPWRWINHHVRAPERHIHLEGGKSVEMLPWFWASVKADPHNIDAWTAAWYTANSMLKDRALARRILDEAKAKNPDSLEIALTEARFVYDGGKGDAAAAELLLEEARSMGRRKCGGRLSELSPHEAEAFCCILDYLSKIYERRGAKDAIRPLIEEVRATGVDTPVTESLLQRIRKTGK